MQFMVIAFDGRDPEAPARRQRARPDHLAGVEKLLADRRLIAGGAILDDAGNMIGSASFMDFPSRAELDGWLRTDPYVTQGVWQDITVRPVRLVVPAAK